MYAGADAAHGPCNNHRPYQDPGISFRHQIIPLARWRLYRSSRCGDTWAACSLIFPCQPAIFAFASLTSSLFEVPNANTERPFRPVILAVHGPGSPYGAGCSLFSRNDRRMSHLLFGGESLEWRMAFLSRSTESHPSPLSLVTRPQPNGYSPTAARHVNTVSYSYFKSHGPCPPPFSQA